MRRDIATSTRLAPETERRLDFLAAKTGRTKAFYLRELIERGIEDLEDYYSAAEVLERIRNGEEPVHAAADVRRDLRRPGSRVARSRREDRPPP